ncbi:MAG: sulfatase-like hydrolase/transferase, partial [Anaerovibrio sp.]|nr:sulfatase-like hydrolase/transferase [Anaerovibrio sp.]
MDRKKIGTYIINSIICWALMNVLFYATTGDSSISFNLIFTAESLICGLLIFITQFTSGYPLFHKKWAPFLFITGWWYIYALYKYMFIDAGPASHESEIIAGMGGAASFMMGQFLLEKYTSKKALLYLLDGLQFIYCLPPILSLIHYQLYGTLITYEEATAIRNTNFRESFEWIMTYMGPLYIGLVAIALAGLFLLINRLRTLLSSQQREDRKPPVLIASIGITLAVSLLPWNMWSQTDFMGPYIKAVRYSMGLSQYYRNIEAKKDSIAISDDTPITSSPHTIIIVIGESATRDKMKAFTPDYKYEDTPWLSQQLNNPNFIIFKNAYACQSLTQQVLESALTEKSAYNEKEFLDSMNIIDIAKKKGYKTYWITNLGKNNNESSFFNVASRADELLNTGDDDDHSMLAELSKINPLENNLIILHGNGSHAAYKERYPKEKAVFTEDSK